MDTRLIFVLLFLFGIWLGVLTYFVYKILKLFTDLKGGVTEDLGKKGFNEVNKRLSDLESEAKHHSQKISLVRFNPFRELGGDHSFCLAILDGENTGIVITSLHTRDRTRVYMKKINKGKSDIELSIEENKALDGAIKNR